MTDPVPPTPGAAADQPPVRRLAVTCARCGRPAAEFALYPAALAGPKVWATQGTPAAKGGGQGEGDRLERAGFLGHVIRYGAYADLARLFALLVDGEWGAARGADADLVAFFCRACGRPYCEACWGPRRLIFDDGFYDCAYADCPEGHEQIVDD